MHARNCGLHRGMLHARGKRGVGAARFDKACPELVEGLRTSLSEQADTHDRAAGGGLAGRFLGTSDCCEISRSLRPKSDCRQSAGGKRIYRGRSGGARGYALVAME
jgi:hypothetical protein